MDRDVEGRLVAGLRVRDRRDSLFKRGDDAGFLEAIAEYVDAEQVPEFLGGGGAPGLWPSGDGGDVPESKEGGAAAAPDAAGADGDDPPADVVAASDAGGS